MLPFQIRFCTGEPVYEQVIYAVKKALVTGALRTGEVFPSVRVLSQELKINPNTAHKIVAALVGKGILQVRSGIGTVVAPIRPATREQRRDLLEDEVERLVVEGRRIALELEDLQRAIEHQWKRLS